jgi:hypothetical protein
MTGLALLLAWLLAGGWPVPRTEPLTHGEAPLCVAGCVKRDQMRAVGPEVIAADCRAECGIAPKP